MVATQGSRRLAAGIYIGSTSIGFVIHSLHHLHLMMALSNRALKHTTGGDQELRRVVSISRHRRQQGVAERDQKLAQSPTPRSARSRSRNDSASMADNKASSLLSRSNIRPEVVLGSERLAKKARDVENESCIESLKGILSDYCAEGVVLLAS